MKIEEKSEKKLKKRKEKQVAEILDVMRKDSESRINSAEDEPVIFVSGRFDALRMGECGE